MEGHEGKEAEVGRHGDTAAVILWMGAGQPWLPPTPAPPPTFPMGYLGLLQAVVEAPEVLGEELGTDGLPVDSDPLTYLNQVWRATGT